MNTTPRMYADVTNAAAAILEHTREHGGGTFDAYTGESLDMDSGFMVSTAYDTAIVDAGQDDAAIVDAIAAFIQRQPATGDVARKPNIGTWLHEGHIYVDPVECIMDREEAIAAGKAREELAIWDNAAGEEIATI